MKELKNSPLISKTDKAIMEIFGNYLINMTKYLQDPDIGDIDYNMIDSFDYISELALNGEIVNQKGIVVQIVNALETINRNLLNIKVLTGEVYDNIRTLEGKVVAEDITTKMIAGNHNP